jgi:hypothetical protein
MWGQRPLKGADALVDFATEREEKNKQQTNKKNDKQSINHKLSFFSCF